VIDGIFHDTYDGWMLVRNAGANLISAVEYQAGTAVKERNGNQSS
jgi:hypothetical protein